MIRDDPSVAVERLHQEGVGEAQFHPAVAADAEQAQPVESRPPGVGHAVTGIGHHRFAAEHQAPAGPQALAQPDQQGVEIEGMVEGLEKDDPVERLARESLAEHRLFGLHVEAHRGRLPFEIGDRLGVDVHAEALHPHAGEHQQQLAAAGSVFQNPGRTAGGQRQQPGHVAPAIEEIGQESGIAE